ncbi:hypothetical protein SNE40_022923 [Patella caerulea]|uniref:Prokineticin domain-containing protein n=1 Tax=Patella caerulea TaxID=87958 RepID=A0AAN8FXB2_PATCE
MYVLFVLLLGLQIVTCAVITNSQEQPCSMGAACSQSNSASYVNNVRYCCPNGNGISLSSSSGMYNNGQTYTTCTCHAGTSFISQGNANVDWDAFNRGMQQMAWQLSNMFRGNPLFGR